jgi:pimeloyl-ACP methyl ester carboxylesterase
MKLAIVYSTAAAALALLSASGGHAVSDPSGARCDAPPVRFGAARVYSVDREVDVHFTCSGAVLAGTLYLPSGPGRHPAVVWVHGSGEATRLTYGGFVAAFVNSGIAVFSYDKRGVGASQGVCCPGDESHFNLLAADADGAVNALRSRTDIDPRRIGLVGASQAGWIVPLAADRSRHRVAFTALISGPAVTTGEEALWSRLAGEDEPGRLPKAKKAEITRRLVPSGYDPLPSIARMDVPGLWLYGGQDKSIPAERSAAVLRRLRGSQGKDFTVVVFPDGDHNLAASVPTLVRWVAARTS